MIEGLSLLQLYNSVEFSIPLSPCSTLLEKALKEIQFFKFKLFYKMSTTRSQKRRNDQQSTGENVSEGLISPIVVGNPCSSNQDDEVAGPSKPKSPRIENSLLESLRASLKEEITSEIKNLLIESQKEMLKLLKPETRGIIRENTEEEVEEETRSFYTPTKSVRISSTQNDPIACRNTRSFQHHVVRIKKKNIKTFFKSSTKILETTNFSKINNFSFLMLFHILTPKMASLARTF